MPKTIKKEVSDATHLRRFVTDLVRQYETAEEVNVDSEIRSAMVDNVLDIAAEPIELLLGNCVGTEFGLYLDAMDDDEDTEDGEDGEDGDAEEDEDGEDGDAEEDEDAAIEAEFEEAEAADEAA